MDKHRRRLTDFLLDLTTQDKLRIAITALADVAQTSDPETMHRINEMIVTLRAFELLMQLRTEHMPCPCG